MQAETRGEGRRRRARRRVSIPLGVAVALFLLTPAVGAASFKPSAIKHVGVNGARLGYRSVGSGPPLVLITGFGTTMAEWDPALVAHLAHQRKVIVFDNRGAGDSIGARVKHLTIQRMADDTAALIRKLVPNGRADVLGWSMGGYIAQELALRHRHDVRRLVLASTDPGGSKAVELTNRRVLRILRDPRATTKQRLSILFPPGHRREGRRWTKSLGRWPGVNQQSFVVPSATLKAQVRAAGIRWYRKGQGAYPHLHGIHNRTLVAAGRNDVVVPPVNSKLIADALPRSRMRRFDHAGHAFLFQLPRTFAKLTNHFLR
jgi:pimeloyl-ACP methyl ester carboxylesterase